MSDVDQIDLDELKRSAAEACNLMKVLSNTDRLILLCQIAQRECCVSELEQLLDIRQPTLSQQLTVLRDEGLVTTRRDGKKIFYRLDSTPAEAVLQVLYQQYCPNQIP